MYVYTYSYIYMYTYIKVYMYAFLMDSSIIMYIWQYFEQM